ncbi:MAG: hypothetical protein FWG03_06600, partial [Clostridiales bacterium]|nr:hypothetical protein [Clostridiales bacterium]
AVYRIPPRPIVRSIPYTPTPYNTRPVLFVKQYYHDLRTVATGSWQGGDRHPFILLAGLFSMIPLAKCQMSAGMLLCAFDSRGISDFLPKKCDVFSLVVESQRGFATKQPIFAVICRFMPKIMVSQTINVNIRVQKELQVEI